MPNDKDQYAGDPRLRPMDVDLMLWRPPLVVGPHPNRDFDPARPALQGLCARRLAKACGLDEDHADYEARFFELFQTTNLIDWCPADDLPGAAREELNENALRMKPLLRHRLVVGVGLEVAVAFGFPTTRWFDHLHNKAYQFIFNATPHPSGLNRWWNESSNVEQAEHYWRQYRRLAERSERIRADTELVADLRRRGGHRGV
jgi:hypothetical protein